MSGHVVGSPVTSRALPDVMTSLTDHSVASILRHSDNDVNANRAIGHVVNTSQQYGGDGYATGEPEAVFIDGSSQQVRTKPHVELEHPDLWNQFYRLCTEMVITKSGRRMFPALKLKVSGLDADVNYVVMVDIVPVDCYRYKYQDNRWVVAGKADQPVHGRQIHVHQDSPASGHHWMSRTLSFHKLKLTNNVVDKQGHIILNSMHRYQPRVYILESRDVNNSSVTSSVDDGLSTFVFAETQFIAVTAYQNDKITQLKIDNNPFAKGFRETGAGRCEKKRQQSKDSSIRLLTDSVSSTSSRDSPDDVIDRCSSSRTGDVTHDARTDDVTMTLRAGGTVLPQPTILLTHDTVPVESLDYRSMLVGAALARQEMMTSLNRDYSQSHSRHLNNHRYYCRRFTPYVITNDYLATSFRPT